MAFVRVGRNSRHADLLAKNLINHVVLVLDESGSMWPYRQSVIKVVDGLVEQLAERSKVHNQETRVSVYTFDSMWHCVVWDKDVLRLPSIGTFYSPTGNTALIDATVQAITDIREIPMKYGDHTVLMYVVTDGEENNSQHRAPDLKIMIESLTDHWTLAALVPNAMGVHEAKRYGFPAGNIEQWDTRSERGVEVLGERLAAVTETYMTSRAAGTRSTTSLFSMTADTVNAKSIRSAKLRPIDDKDFALFDITCEIAIRPFIQEQPGLDWVTGRALYQLVKRETVQPQKIIAIRHKRTGKVYLGRNARELLGLSLNEVRISPQQNPDYDVFIQSTSVNRKLVPGQKLIYLHFQP